MRKEKVKKAKKIIDLVKNKFILLSSIGALDFILTVSLEEKIEIDGVKLSFLFLSSLAKPGLEEDLFLKGVSFSGLVSEQEKNQKTLKRRKNEVTSKSTTVAFDVPLQGTIWTW